MSTNHPANDDERLLQVARWARRRGVQAVARALTAALQGGDLADLERIMNPPAPAAGVASVRLPGGVKVFGLAGLSTNGVTVVLKVGPPIMPPPRLVHDRGAE